MKKALHYASEELFWYWIVERHGIYLRRKAGAPKPWTADPILQRYKFTNPFRQNDAGTVWLTNFLAPHLEGPLDLLFFNIGWYRMFNWTGTGDALGWQTDWNKRKVKATLRKRLADGLQVFTGAHIVRSEFGRPKIDSIVDQVGNLWRDRHDVVNVARATRRLEDTFMRVLEFPYVGPFTAYEIVTDMRHTPLLNDAVDILTWANPGPGCQRGLRRLGMPFKGDEGVESMRQLLGRALDATGLILEMRDIEHSLCEFDKYCRVNFGEGKPRATYPGVAE